jgi:hypothetical protein
MTYILWCIGVRVKVTIFYATFSNISAISWRLVSLVEETGVPGENYRPVASEWQTISHNVLSSTPRLGFEGKQLWSQYSNKRKILTYCVWIGYLSFKHLHKPPSSSYFVPHVTQRYVAYVSMTRYVSVVDVWLLSFGIDGSVSSTTNTFPAIFWNPCHPDSNVLL